MNLRSGIRILAVFSVGFAYMSGAQVASKPVATNTKTEQQLPPAGSNLPDICVTSAQKAAQLASHGPHTVKLSWHASLPATTRQTDAISCYVIYRAAVSWDPGTALMIGVTRAPDTTYVDLHVDSGNYYYAVRAVSQRGVKSDFSEKLRVQVPR